MFLNDVGTPLIAVRFQMSLYDGCRRVYIDHAAYDLRTQILDKSDLTSVWRNQFGLFTFLSQIEIDHLFPNSQITPANPSNNKQILLRNTCRLKIKIFPFEWIINSFNHICSSIVME